MNSKTSETIDKLSATSDSLTARLQREAEAARAGVADTLSELRDRMAPERLVDQAVGLAKHSGAPEMAREVTRTVREHPLPFLLIGAGVGLLAATTLGAKQMSGSGRMASMRRQASEYADHARQKVGGAASAVADKFSDGTSGARSALSSQMSGVAGKANRIGDFAQRTWSRTVEEQPLLLVGLGLLAGVVVGLSIPSSRPERELMGDRADELRRGVRDTALQQVDVAKTAARDAYRGVIEEFDERGLTPGAAKEAARSAAERVKTTLENVGNGQAPH
jgi:ElaB/YqjD/DUF883 family membrane-anchored ribosome-binding protein